jgi:hypothetical protein
VVAPPVRSGQAVAGVLPGASVPVGLGAAVVGVEVAGTAVAVRVAVGPGAVVVEAAVGWLVAAVGLGLFRGRTTRSGPQAATTTTTMDTKSAPYRRRRPINASIVTHHWVPCRVR